MTAVAERDAPTWDLGSVRIEELRSFLVLSETLNFHRAAGRLFVSPGGLSRRIAHLEGALGVELLHTSTRGVALTEQGKAFSAAVRSALGLLGGLPAAA